MGMFDTIICHAPLPGVEGTGGSYQTKDLDCALDTFEITADGRLVHHYREWESTPKELLDPKRPYIGCIRVKAGTEKLVDRNYHGWLDFEDFRAKFTDGVMVRVERVDGH